MHRKMMEEMQTHQRAVSDLHLQQVAYLQQNQLQARGKVADCEDARVFTVVLYRTQSCVGEQIQGCFDFCACALHCICTRRKSDKVVLVRAPRLVHWRCCEIQCKCVPTNGGVDSRCAVRLFSFQQAAQYWQRPSNCS